MLAKLMASVLMLCSLAPCVFAQNNSVWSDYDASPLEIKHVVKSTPRPINLMDLLTIRDFQGVQISPDGKKVAYVVSQPLYQTNAYRTALFVIGTNPNSTPLYLGSAGPPRWSPAGEFRDYPLRWSADSRYITTQMKIKNTWQIVRWNSAGGEPQQLSHNANDVQEHDYSPDGNKITFTVTEPADPAETQRLLEQGIVYDRSFIP